MGWEFDAELGVKRVPDRVEPVKFRGVDCAELAERYVAYRRNMGLDVVETDPDLIRTLQSASSENV